MGRYSKTQITKKSLLPRSKNVVQAYNTTIYDRIPKSNGDLHLIATEGDRLDNLAYQFYGNPNLWWYIGKANGINTMNVPAGTSIRIPASTDFNTGT